MPPTEELASVLLEELAPLNWRLRIEALAKRHPHLRLAFSTSFGLEDQAITHLIAGPAPAGRPRVRIFTLDTGRLFEQVHTLHQQTCDRYGLSIQTWHPDPERLQAFVADHGVNAFYRSVAHRLTCCRIRKVEPLARALADADVWISGLRREQSDHRSDLPMAEWDPAGKLIKVYPLADVTTEEIWSYVRAHDVPYNPMHEQGFPSVGCAPCTRAVLPGEHPRAGRWWWEQGETQECGLHQRNGRLTRAGSDRGDPSHA